MSDNIAINKIKPIQLRYYALVIVLIWSLFITLLFLWNYNTEKAGTYEAARIQARAAFEKDILYRHWNTVHGGLYAPVTETNQPNPYLKVPERDIKTQQGQKLTKINPAYMTRQVHEIAMKTYGVKGHITSLNPIRPENTPDEWESNALKAFEKGAKEISSAEMIEGENYMRLMRPLITEEGCLKCHAEQGYQLGDIRGGISVAVPLAPLIAIEKASNLIFSIIYGLVWLVGITGIGIGMYFLSRQIVRRFRAEEELRQSEKLRGVIEMAGAVCHELNQPLQAISGYSELILMDLEDGKSPHDDIKSIKKQIDRMRDITKKLMNITRYETTDYLNGKIIDIDKATK